MATPTRTQVPPRTAASPLNTLYLTLYNFVSAALWTGVLIRTVQIGVLGGEPRGVYTGIGEYTKWTQTLALLEVAHSVLGIVRAPVVTTVMQVASRILLVWGIADVFPRVAAGSAGYMSMLVAWSVTEVVRYSYFVFFLTGRVPGVLSWLRYNAFFVLYPLGISSEVWLVYQAIPSAMKLSPLFGYGLWAVLAVYVPGSYVLYSHMMTQRRRIMRGKQRARE
ncbi:PTPLA-domain-containing protein [Trichodelitschia bisporula]|uniref:Very-long-chain (3R)-3-hydroxyacyl-CoA dehydratase n=1 Tax=Trichodelitschia bisporula TaxID=703511 RepID=A0A6G1HL36_9PEZI|nr:PTPLA-domain-containing protein [Trichodelitschia bisporula]